MILESFNICQSFCEKHDEEYEFIKSINDVMFKQFRDDIRNPTSLILSMGDLGRMYYKKTKTSFKLMESNTQDEEIKEGAKKILEMYKVYDKDKLNYKYEKFGKESHDAHILARKEKKLSKSKKIEFK